MKEKESFMLFESDIDVQAFIDKGKFLRENGGANSLDSIHSSRMASDPRRKPHQSPVKNSDHRISIYDQQGERRLHKLNQNEVDVNYDDFRQSILSSVSPKDYKRVRKIESFIQNIIREKDHDKQQPMPPVGVEGSLKNQSVIMKAQNVRKSIRMHQTTLKFDHKHKDKKLISKQMEQ